MTEEQLLAKYPRLYHMAHDGAWPALEQNGLLSVEALVDLYQVDEPLKTELLAVHRPESVPIARKGFPGAVIRDQKPMSEKKLTKALAKADISPSDWYRKLNSFSFLWLHPNRVRRLIGARAYRGSAQTVLTIDTKSLLNKYRGSIHLSPINSGNTTFKAMERSYDTFHTIADFPYDDRRKTRSDENNVVELVVDYAIPDLKKHVLAVHRMQHGAKPTLLWNAPGVDIVAP